MSVYTEQEAMRVSHDQVDHRHAHVHGDGPWVRHKRLHERPASFWGKVRQFFSGFLFFEWYHELQHERAKYNDVMNRILFGELIEDAPHVH